MLLKTANMFILILAFMQFSWSANYSQVVREESVNIQAGDIDTYSVRPKGLFELIGYVDEKECSSVVDSFNELGGYSGSDYFLWLSNNSAVVSWVKVGSGWVEYFNTGPGISIRHVYRIGNVVNSESIDNIYILNRSIHNDIEFLDKYGDECRRIEAGESCDDPARLIKYALGGSASGEIGAYLGAPVDLIQMVTSDDGSQKIIYSESKRKMIRNVGFWGGVRWAAYKIGGEYYVSSFPVSGFARPEIMIFKLKGAVDLRCLVAPKKWG